MKKGLASSASRERTSVQILVQLGRDEVQPFEQLVALLRIAGRRRIFARLVGDHLDDDRPLGDQFARIERQHRHLAFRVDLQKVVTVFQLLGAQVDLDQIVGQAGLEKGDMGG